MRRLACGLSIALDLVLVVWYLTSRYEIVLAVLAAGRLAVTCICFAIGEKVSKVFLIYWCALNCGLGIFFLVHAVFLSSVYTAKEEIYRKTRIAMSILSLVSSWFLWIVLDWLRTKSRVDTVDIFIYAGQRFDHLSKSIFRRTRSEEGNSLLQTTRASNQQRFLVSSLHFFKRFAQRSESIRAFWTEQLRREAMRASKVFGLVDGADEYFDLLLRLFAHEDNILEPLYQALIQNSQVLAFFSLQLSGFLLFGAFWNTEQLRSWMFKLCQNDLRFAHRVNFFLDAWLPGLRLGPTAQTDIIALKKEIQDAAGPLALRLEVFYAKTTDIIQTTTSIAFAETPRFLRALTTLSARLTAIKDHEQRDFLLKKGLEELDAQLSQEAHRVNYLPLVGYENERIVRIHAAESKLFATKDRCPFLVCLELEEILLIDDASESQQQKYFYHESQQQTTQPAKPLVLSPRFFLKKEEVFSPSRSFQDLTSLQKNASSSDIALGQWSSAGIHSTREQRFHQQTEEDIEKDSTMTSVSIDDDDQARRPTVVFRERWAQKEARILKKPIIDSNRRTRLVPLIVKANDDLRQEQFASQLVALSAAILRSAHISVQLRPYEVLATSLNAGIIEALPDTVSLDALRKNDDRYTTLLDFFERFFGRSRLPAARTAFIESLAPACIICYLLNLKDRHNGNILLDTRGRVSHIDFGYMLASSPGGNIGFEAAPFKLTNDFLEVIGSDRRKFDDLCYRSFIALRKHKHRLILLAEMTVATCDSLPCFDGRPRETLDLFIQRFKPELRDRQCRSFVRDLIDKSINNWRTSLYDVYQRRCVGIF